MNKTYKVDFVIGRMNSGGAQRVIANIANYLAQRNFEIRIITFMEGDAYELDDRIERIKYVNHNFFLRARISCFFNLFKFYFKKSNRPDIISAHIGGIGYPTIPLAKLYRIKIIVSEHINHVQPKKTIELLVLWNFLYKYANALTVLTNYDLPYFSKRNSKVVVMENPCSFAIKNDLNERRERSIIAIGNLDRYLHKGFDNLIEIASVVLPKHPSWSLKIIGEGEEGKEYLKKMVLQYKIENQVSFMGFRSDIKEIMSNSEIYILSSRYEGLPMVLLEALSQRMACISFDCVTGPSEIIENNFNGFLVEDQNKLLMAEKLLELIENEDIRKKFQRNAPKVLEKYSIENVGHKWDTLIKEIVG